MKTARKAAWMTLGLVIGAVMPSVARADLCQDYAMAGVNDSKMTDGVAYSGAVTKMKIPDGTIKATRDAMIAGGWSAAWLDAHVSLAHATTDWVMPGCASFKWVGFQWLLAVGPWKALFSTSIEVDKAGQIAVECACVGLAEPGTLLSEKEATALVKTCTGPEDVVIESVETNAVYKGGFRFVVKQNEKLATVDLETGKLTCDAAPGLDANGARDESDAGFNVEVSGGGAETSAPQDNADAAGFVAADAVAKAAADASTGGAGGVVVDAGTVPSDASQAAQASPPAAGSGACSARARPGAGGWAIALGLVALVWLRRGRHA